MGVEAYSNPTPLPDTVCGWRVTKIEDLCKAVTSGGTPLRSMPEFYEGGTHSWFKTGELRDALLAESEEKITDRALAESSAKLFPKGTVLMAMYGDGITITKLGLLTKEAASNQACCAMIADSAICDPRFLFYALKYHREDFIRLASGGAQRNLSGALIRRFAINAPPVGEQRVIAHVLGTLDDKIELSRRMNETRTAIARAIFKDWFVDFGPTHAKAGCRSTHLPEHLMELFSSKLADSELGECPEGWAVVRVGDLCERIFSGGTPSTSEPSFWGGGIPWLSSGETRVPFVIDTEKTITKTAISNSSTRLVRKGATVIASAGQGHTRGQTSMILLDSYINQSVVALEANLPVISDCYLYFDLERRYEQFRQISDGHSSRGSLTTVLLANIKTTKPPRQLVQAFDDIVRPIVNRIEHALLEMKAIEELRNALLPKLISGEIRIQDAEKFLSQLGT